MPLYLYQASYTADAWANLVNKPQDRAQAIRPMIKQLKGKLVSFYLAFGEHDLVLVVDMPNNEAAAAFSIAATAGGAIKTIRTTPLMTVAEGMRAMRAAKRAGYAPPA
ncbi:MAG: GYD domain-containing protein [Dehalococcoidia bacterium]